MTTILYGAPVVEKIFLQTKALIEKNHIQWYLAIFMIWDNHPGKVYVKKKKEYAEKLWLTVRVFSDFTMIDKDITTCNNDIACLWIIIQLPLPDNIADRKQELLDAISPSKDADCLWSTLLSQVAIHWWQMNIAPATPSAVMHLLDYYQFLLSLEWNTIAVLWQSDLIGKPLADILERYWTRVFRFDEYSDQDHMRKICKESDMIISATGKLHLVDETFVKDDQTQIIIDVWRWMLHGKPAGDVNTARLIGKVGAITPVPGGIWPITVASLFWNLVKLYSSK